MADRTGYILTIDTWCQGVVVSCWDESEDRTTAPSLFRTKREARAERSGGEEIERATLHDDGSVTLEDARITWSAADVRRMR
jgi:hypothetical protein